MDLITQRSEVQILPPQSTNQRGRTEFHVSADASNDFGGALSHAKERGRAPISTEIRKLVRTMAAANVLWGAPRIHRELLKLGFEISERTVSRLIPKRPK